MRNRKELRDARRKAEEARVSLLNIEALPRRAGSLVQWGAPGRSDGVIWRRVGDDQWEPLHRDNGYEPQAEFGTFPSAHVANTWQGWAQIKRLPDDAGSGS